MKLRASSVVVRAPQFPVDIAQLERLDIGFVTDSIYEVVRESRGFSLVERSIEPALRKNYLVNWGELEAANGAIVAAIESVIVGVASLKYESWNRRAVVEHLYVDAGARGRGVGSQLLRRLREHANVFGARSLFVETQNVNPLAVRFYERRGFTLAGLDTSLYAATSTAGETALYFEMSLGDRQG